MTTQKRVVLIIDDEIDSLTLLSRAIGTAYNVIAKNDGSEALRWLQAGNTPDLIITDIMMPNMDGAEFVKILRSSKSHRHTPIIVVSANSDVRTRIKFLQMGVNDYLGKPIHPEELVLRINNIFKLLSRAE
ncbi:MAG: two-component system response regulator [Chloroherpetonaceae bacterium]